MSIRPLGLRVILRDYIPTQTPKGIHIPEKLRQRYLYSNARWATVLALGTQCPQGHLCAGDIVLAHYDQATAMPETPGVWSVPFHAILAKTEPNEPSQKSTQYPET